MGGRSLSTRYDVVHAFRSFSKYLPVKHWTLVMFLNYQSLHLTCFSYLPPLDLSISIALDHSAFSKENVDSKYCSLRYFPVMHSQPIKSPGAIRSRSSSSPSISSPLITFSTPKNTPEAFAQDVLDLSTNHVDISVHERTLLFLAPALYLQYASGKTHVFPFPFICLIVLQRLTEFKI